MTARTIKYSQRLGDVLRCLPACKYLSDQGHEVFFDCLPQYQGVFELTSYVKAGQGKGQIIDLEVWPNRYEEYRNSKMTWTDFVYNHPEIEQADKTNIILDKLDAKKAGGLPDKFNLIAPFGISQGYRVDPVIVIRKGVEEFGQNNLIVLCPPEWPISGLKTYTAKSTEQMAKAIRDADNFWCVNSAPLVLASATRREKQTRCWGQKNEWVMDNLFNFEGLSWED